MTAPSYDELTTRMAALHERLLRSRCTLATAESCTGGLLGAVLTSHGGSSAYYKGGAIPYSNEAKTALADVAPELIHGHGAVSGVVAQAMATGARTRLGADIGLGITGIAGPDGATAGKPVGLVYAAVDSDAHSRARKAQLRFDREGNRRAGVALALELLEEALDAGLARA